MLGCRSVPLGGPRARRPSAWPPTGSRSGPTGRRPRRRRRSRVESLLDDVARAAGPRSAGAAPAQRRRRGRPLRVRAAFPRLRRTRLPGARCADHPLWAARASWLPEGEGIGVAIGWWPGGYEPAAAVCRLDADGRLTVITGAADMTGVETAFASIAAEAFGVDADRVRVVNADTSSAPYAGTSGGSKVTYTVGRAVERAAHRGPRAAAGGGRRRARDRARGPRDRRRLGPAARSAGQGDRDRRAGCARSSASAAGTRPSRATGASAQPQAPQAAAHLSHVRVDPDTGAVTVAGPCRSPRTSGGR